MTDMKDIFNAGAETLQQGARVRGLKKGAEALQRVNIMEELFKRGVDKNW